MKVKRKMIEKTFEKISCINYINSEQASDSHLKAKFLKQNFNVKL